MYLLVAILESFLKIILLCGLWGKAGYEWESLIEVRVQI